MSKIITEKTKAIYEFLVKKNKEVVERGKELPPTCYAISFDAKNEVAVLPIPLADLQTPDERRFLLSEMGRILKKEKVKIKMFMLTTEAWMSRAKADKKTPYLRPSLDPNKMEVLIFSARDCFDNINYQMHEMKRDDKKKVTLKMLPESKEEWIKQEAGKERMVIQDTLLDAIWTEYRGVK